MNLPEFSVKHSIFGNMLTVFVILGGFLLITLLQRDTFPDIEIDVLNITTVYPNASPQEVEELITTPIEEEIREVEGIDEYSSTSVEGISVITVKLAADAKYKERIISDIQQKVDQVQNIPDEAEDPLVAMYETRSPIIRASIYGEVPERELRHFAEHLERKLEDVSGVSAVIPAGWREEEFWVEVDPIKLADQQISLFEINSALARRNITRPGGKVVRDASEIVLRTVGQFHSEEEIEAVIIRSNREGRHVTVGDVASVRRAFEEDDVQVRMNSQRAIVLAVRKKRSADTIDVSDEIKRVLEQAQEEAPEGVFVTYIDDESFYVKRRLQILSANGIIGFFLVVIILFLFLNFRVAMITGIGIPFAFLTTLMVMSATGITVNLMTMFGLIIVLGMVVDDAIIVGENIFRHIEEGMRPKEAAIVGTQEVMWPVVSTVLTTIAAFAPLAFAPDVFGQILKWLPIIVGITLVASLFEVLFVMPCHVSDFVRPMKVVAGQKARKPVGHRLMGGVIGVYVRLLRFCLKLRYVFFLLVILFFVGLLMFVKANIKVDIFPADLIDIFSVKMETAQGMPREQTAAIFEKIEEKVRALPKDEFVNMISFVGGHSAPEGGFSARGSQYASAFVYLTSQSERVRKTQTIVDQLREACRDVEGVESLEFTMLKPGPPTGKPLEVLIRGDDFDTLRAISKDVQAYLNSVPKVYDVQRDFKDGKNELHIEPKFEEVSRLGLQLDTLAQTVWTAFQGAEAAIVREGSEELKVRVWLEEPYRDQPESLDLLLVPNNTGRLIELNRVASFKNEIGLPTIYHFDGTRAIVVSASFEEGADSVAVNQELLKKFEQLPLERPGYNLIPRGEWKETRKLLIFMVKAFLVAMLLIYVILAIQFDSFLQPAVVMVSIPMGLIGVSLALLLHGKPLSIMAAMGMVGLAGVVVNDAIVLVKFINDRRRNDGVPLFEALVESGQKRFRPIILTTITTIAGLMPVIYGWGGYEPFVAPAAIALSYGLLCATFLTLMVVPCVYYIFIDMKKCCCWILRRPLPK